MAEKEQQMPEGPKKTYKVLLYYSILYMWHVNWYKLAPYLSVAREIKEKKNIYKMEREGQTEKRR